ncbi:MAG: VOC family protein [Pseudomonadota bacterium]
MSASAVSPFLRYEEPEEAATWLCEAFGFKVGNIERETDGQLICITLDAGSSTIVIGPVDGTQLDGLLVQPAEVGGFGTQTCYAHVADVQAHYEQAAAVGANIEVEPDAADDGSMFYLCRDPEGHLWSFGTMSFSPDIPAVSHLPVVAHQQAQPKHSLGRRVGAVVAVSALLLGGSMIVYAVNDSGRPSQRANANHAPTFVALREESQRERERRIAAETAAKSLSVRHSEAVAAGARLKTALNDAQSSLQELRLRSKEIEQRATTSEVAAAQSINKMSTELSHTRQQLAALDKAKRTALTSATTAAEKLAKATELNRVLREKLDQATSTIASVRERNSKLATAMARLRSTHQSELRESKQRLAFASSKFSEVTSQLTIERQRADVAENELAKTISQLDTERAAAKQLSEKVAWLQAKLGDTYSNLRLRFVAIESQDIELALAKMPATLIKQPTVEVTPPVPSKRERAKSRKVVRKAKASKAIKKASKTVKKAAVPPKLQSPCARAVWASFGQGRSQDDRSMTAMARRLCAGAARSAEPVKCYKTVMSGAVNWGGGNQWQRQNALKLCAGTVSTQATLTCFKSSLQAEGWRQAVAKCSTG